MARYCHSLFFKERSSILVVLARLIIIKECNMSYTDEQYRQLGTQISAEQWKSRDWHKENLSIVSSLARLDFSKWVVLQVREHK